MNSSRISRRDFIDTCAVGGASLGLLGLGGVDELARSVARVPIAEVGNVSQHPGLYWHVKEGKETVCDLCPSRCVIQPGERGTCGVRENINGAYTSMIYARPCEIRADPMEKGPFFHFLPGTSTLALGFAGCNLDCKYCQSAAFAKARPEVTDNKTLSAQGLVRQLKQYGYKSVTFTFSEPMQAIEYVLDVAKLARPNGIKVMVHTAAHFLSQPFDDLCRHLDGLNVDLKGFSESFYQSVTGGSLEPVLNNIKRAARYRDAGALWLELTNLVVPGYNDSDNDFLRMSQWIAQNCGIYTPLHVSKFFPQYKFRNVPPTPNDTLRRLRKVAVYQAGLKYVYLGNMPGDPGESTYCPKCGVKIVSRTNYEAHFTDFDPERGICTKCGLRIPGVWS